MIIRIIIFFVVMLVVCLVDLSNIYLDESTERLLYFSDETEESVEQEQNVSETVEADPTQQGDSANIQTDASNQSESSDVRSEEEDDFAQADLLDDDDEGKKLNGSASGQNSSTSGEEVDDFINTVYREGGK